MRDPAVLLLAGGVSYTRDERGAVPHGLFYQNEPQVLLWAHMRTPDLGRLEAHALPFLAGWEDSVGATCSPSPTMVFFL